MKTLKNTLKITLLANILLFANINTYAACTSGTDYCWDTATKVSGCCTASVCVASSDAACTITTGCAANVYYTYPTNSYTPNLD